MCTWHRSPSTYTQVELFPELWALVLFEHPIIIIRDIIDIRTIDTDTIMIIVIICFILGLGFIGVHRYN